MNQPKKILILYTSVGLGHKSVAENIGYYLTQAGYEVRLEDIVKTNEGLLIFWAKATYNLIAFKLPFIWRFLHNSERFSDWALPWRVKIAGRNYQKTLDLVQSFQPDAVICTQTTASAVVSYLKQKKLYLGIFGICFSDFLLHRFWLYDNCDFYLANIEEQKQRMISLGVPEVKIFICGVILKPKIEGNIEAVKNKMAIARSQKVILVSGGSSGFGVSADLIKKLSNLQNTKILVACGKNKKLFREIQLWRKENILALGYYSPMDELYAVADAFVSKAGGLSVSEALRFGLPIIIDHVSAGQEELNYIYLLSKKLVLPRSQDVAAQISRELSAGQFRQSLKNNPSLVRLFPDPKILLQALGGMLK